MPNLYDGSMTLAEAQRRLEILQPALEGPDQQALDVVLGRLKDVDHLIDLVKKLRKAQRNYFRTKGGLDECKALESRLDALLKE